MSIRNLFAQDWKEKAERAWLQPLGLPIRGLRYGVYEIKGLKVNRKISKDHGDRHFWFGVSLNYLEEMDEFVFICEDWGWFAIPRKRMQELANISTVSSGQVNFHIHRNMYYTGQGEKIDISNYHNRIIGTVNP